MDTWDNDFLDLVVTCGRRLRVPTHPVQNCNSEEGAAEDPEIGDQWSRGIRRNRTHAYHDWGSCGSSLGAPFFACSIGTAPMDMRQEEEDSNS